MKKLITVFILSLSAVLFLAACTPEDKMDDKMTEDEMNEDMENEMDEEEDAMMNDGNEAPMFVLNDVNGNEFKLADYKGQKVYVKYWASWCSICTAGLGEIDTLSENEDFVVLTVVTPGYKGEQSADDFSKWFNSLDFDKMTVLLDVDGEFSKQFGVIGFPTSIYIGTDGIVTKVLPGHRSNSDVIEGMSEIY
jgi:peptide methionine sulfoxide reductase msrA/msrB